MAKQNDKRSKAKSLYLTGQYEQKEIAEMVGVSQRSITTWKEEDQWEKLKTSLLITRESQLRELYEELVYINAEKKRLRELEKPVDLGLTNATTQTVNNIKKLEGELSIADKVQVGTAFIEMVRKEDVELCKTLAKWFDIFVKASL